MTLEYFKKKHGYEYGRVWYPRVTSICAVIAKPGLEKWLANHGSYSAMQEKRKKITDWGTLIDQILKKMFRKEKIEVPSLILPSIKAGWQFLKDNKVETVDTDTLVKSKEHFYAGTLDVLAEINGKLGVLDIKTSTGFWDEQFLQTAAYVQAYNETAKRQAQTHWILRIDQYQECQKCSAQKREKAGLAEIKGGNSWCNHNFGQTKGVYELKEVDNHQMYLEAFLTAKKLWEFSNRQFLSEIKGYPVS